MSRIALLRATADFVKSADGADLSQLWNVSPSVQGGLVRMLLRKHASPNMSILTASHLLEVFRKQGGDHLLDAAFVGTVFGVLNLSSLSEDTARVAWTNIFAPPVAKPDTIENVQRML